MLQAAYTGQDGSETAIYERAGLPFVVPEMREVAASPLAAAIVVRARAAQRDRARALPLPCLQLARLAA